MTEEKGILFNIQKYAIHDGPGIRTTVFLKGCPLACWWCHNPEGQRVAIEQCEPAADSSGGAIEPPETFGWAATTSEVVAEIEKDRIFYEESGGGATFSGGEPLSQARFLKSLLTACAEREIHTAVDTSGYAPHRVVTEIGPLADLFLFDLKLMDRMAHLRYTGVPNELIFENLEALVEMGKPIIIRFPLIPGFTDKEPNIRAVGQYVSTLDTVQSIAVLPYHEIAAGKYTALQLRNRMTDTRPPDEARVTEAASLLASYGLEVTIGG
ncbi:MAG: glycyl-radical enzyme activating protein [Thermodesulfobacteriota bacterium]